MSDPARTPRRQLIRWLLRLLSERAFLQHYLDEGGQSHGFRLFQQTFWALPLDAEHSKEGRDAAWQHLDGARARVGSRPVDWFAGILALLREEAKPGTAFFNDLHELSRYWSLPELFFAPAPPAMTAAGYHEIHCHFRGAVPFETLWAGWLCNARWRASLRKERVEHGSWSTNWAAIVDGIARQPWAACLGERPGRIARTWYQLATRVVVHTRLRERLVPYLAASVGLRRELLHQRSESGLSLFVKRFDRYSRAQKAGRSQAGHHTEQLVIAVLRRFEAEGAVALELRPTFENTRIELQTKLLQFVRGYLRYFQESKRPVKLGLVLSLFKQQTLRSGEPPMELWKHQALVWRTQVAALLEVLRTIPVLRYFVVGIDAAGKERGCPPRAFSPAIDLLHEHHRASGVWDLRPGRVMRLDDFAARLSVGKMNCVQWEPIRLGLTMHAGEDFVDPLSGLRQIAETIDSLDLRRHDRLGHALAAGLTEAQIESMLRRRAGNGEVEHVGGRHFRLLKPRGEHLLDLAWAYGEAHDDASGRLVGALLSHAAAGTFGAPANPDRLAAALASRPHVEAWIPSVRYHEPKGITAEDRVAILVDDTWYSLFEKLRRELVERIARLGIVVESCPTSNCAVANLDQAPIATFLAPKQPELRVAIATDDPALFGAWPSDELARLTHDFARPGDDAARLRQRLLQANREASFVR